MLAFHSDHKVKKHYVTRVELHRKADEIIKGTYWHAGKGCAVGCTLHSSNHASYETELGIPRQIAHLEDWIFEGLPAAKAKNWPVQFLKAIKVGADLSKVWPKFAVWLLTDKVHGVKKYAKKQAQFEAIERVANLYKRVIRGEVVSQQEFINARQAYAYANAAAYAAAYAAAANAAAYAAADAAANAAYASNAANAAYTYADAAAYAAADAAANAAYAYADAAAYAAAYAAANAANAAYAADAAGRSKCYEAQSKKLLQLLKDAPKGKPSKKGN